MLQAWLYMLTAMSLFFIARTAALMQALCQHIAMALQIW